MPIHERNAVETWHQTQGDTLSPIGGRLLKPDGDPVDLTGLEVVLLVIADADDAVKVNRAAATIVDAEDGLVSYAPSDNDVDTAATYWYWWIVIDPDTGKEDHYPHDGKRRKLEVVASYG